MTRRVTAIALGLLIAATASCGPIEYVNTVTRGADSAVDEARAANAAKWSPYWWTRAVEYLRQARVEAAAADFQAANRFGRLSEEAAVKARDEALLRAANPAAARDLELSAPPPKAERKPGLAPVDEETP